MMVFRLFLKNGSNDFGQNAPECRTNRYRTARENRMSKFCPVLEIFIQKVSILAENDQSGVHRSFYISRTVNDIKNLIWYSESTTNFLSRMYHQIFSYLSSSGWKFDPKTVNFSAFLNGFWSLSGQLLDIFKWNSEVLPHITFQYYFLNDRNV